MDSKENYVEVKMKGYKKLKKKTRKLQKEIKKLNRQMQKAVELKKNLF